jgi:hypothetical protein
MNGAHAILQPGNTHRPFLIQRSILPKAALRS